MTLQPGDTVVHPTLGEATVLGPGPKGDPGRVKVRKNGNPGHSYWTVSNLQGLPGSSRPTASSTGGRRAETGAGAPEGERDSRPRPPQPKPPPQEDRMARVRAGKERARQNRLALERRELETAARDARARADRFQHEYLGLGDYTTDDAVALQGRVLGALARARQLEARLT